MPITIILFFSLLALTHRNPTILESYADGWHAGATRVELGDPTLESEIGYGADARMMGFELRNSMFLTDRIRLELGVDYVQGDRRDKDEPLPFIPPFRTTAGVMYNHNNFNIGGNVRMVSAQERVPDDELPTDSYSLLRLEAGYRFAAFGGGMHTINVRVDDDRQ